MDSPDTIHRLEERISKVEIHLADQGIHLANQDRDISAIKSDTNKILMLMQFGQWSGVVLKWVGGFVVTCVALLATVLGIITFFKKG